MITRTFLFILTSFLIFSTCKKEQPLPENPKIKYGTGSINFSDLRVGQKTTYTRNIGVCEMVELPGLPNPLDTLYLEVIDMDFEKITFSERFSEGSNLFQNGNTRSLTYEVIVDEGFILIPERDSSALFYFYANDTIQLQPATPTELTPDFCLMMTPDSTFIGNDIGKVQEFRFFDKIVENQYVVSCVPSILMIEDGYLLYDKNGLNVSYSVTNQDFQSGIRLVQGWKRLN